MSESDDAAVAGRQRSDPEGDRGGESAEAAGAHLDALPDGSGCAEIWAHLSERRDRDRTERHDERRDRDR